MNEGVKILIERMESNPEDFAERDFDENGKMSRGKFRSVAELLKKRLSGERPAWDAMNVLTTEEIEALTAAYVEMERKKFTNGVMAKLLEEPEQRESYAYTTGPLATTAGSNGVNRQPFTVTTTGTPTVQLGSKKLTEKDVGTLNEMIAKWRGEEDGTI